MPAEAPPPAADTHVHVFEPSRFPYPDGPGYRPGPHETGTVADLHEVLGTHGVSHAVVVQPSGYGTDNTALLDAVARFDGRARGIAAVPVAVQDETLTRLAAGGVVGVRFDLAAVPGDGGDQSAARAFLDRMAARDWLVQVQCPPEIVAGRARLLADSGVRVVIDHLGSPASPDPRQVGLSDLLALGRQGRAVIKLSAPFRFSRQPPPHADLDPLVGEILDAFTPARAVWASDWPFIKLQHRPDYGTVLAQLHRWLPAPADRADVLWTTPARLYGFT